MHILLFDWVRHDHIQLILELSVCVWVAVGKEYVVIIIFKIIRESERVEGSEVLAAILPDPILII